MRAAPILDRRGQGYHRLLSDFRGFQGGQTVGDVVQCCLQACGLIAQTLFFHFRAGRNRRSRHAAGLPRQTETATHARAAARRIPSCAAIAAQPQASAAPRPGIAVLLRAGAISGAASCDCSHSHGSCSVSSGHGLVLLAEKTWLKTACAEPHPTWLDAIEEKQTGRHIPPPERTATIRCRPRIYGNHIKTQRRRRVAQTLP